MRRPTAVLLLLLSSSIPSFAWGPKGHRIIADVASLNLTAAAKRQIKSLLGSDDLASVSIWADEIRNQRPETFGWHFVDIPWTASGFSEPRDCYRPASSHLGPEDHQNCVVDRILWFQQILSDRNAGAAARIEALKFLVHFVADIHQPMHAIAEARGGNDIQISEFEHSMCRSRPCNLHSLWDIGLIEHDPRSEPRYVEYLERLISRENLPDRPLGSPQDWANESFRLAHRVWLADGAEAGEEYFQQNRDALDRRLALAGIRLALLLNQALE